MFEGVHTFLDIFVPSDLWVGEWFVVLFPGSDFGKLGSMDLTLDFSGIGVMRVIKCLWESVHFLLHIGSSHIKFWITVSLNHGHCDFMTLLFHLSLMSSLLSMLFFMKFMTRFSEFSSMTSVLLSLMTESLRVMWLLRHFTLIHLSCLHPVLVVVLGMMVPRLGSGDEEANKKNSCKFKFHF